MASFFISWELWQQMTFCLGAAICLVFVAGYWKLCWTHQYVKKQEAVDEERRTHDLEMRKSGLPAMNKVTEIPFGVRAIQSGIQVDGIWISSHSLPTETQSTLVSMDISIPGRSNAKGKGLDTMAPVLALPSPHTSTLADDSRIEQPLTFDLHYSLQTFHPDALKTYRPPAPLVSEKENSTPTERDALGHSKESDSQARTVLQTYVPIAAQIAEALDDSRQMRDAVSAASCDRETTDTNKSIPIPANKYQTAGPRRPTHHSERRLPAVGVLTPSSHHAIDGSNITRLLNKAAAHVAYPEGTGAVVVPEPWTPPEPGASHPTESGHQHQRSRPTIPSPTFAPGDVHANRSRRIVNPGFEVLPAGTFAAGQNSSGDDADAEESWRHRRPRRLSLGGKAKLRKSPPSTSRG
ncbi:hypothetical protein BN1723_014577 [Verticillium longisporum]|uniref:Uncharacterized protein n=1 Tax=Verticillium longisporum TaxID=100787 RepID=A0A0G4MCR6_VERLO|nr:hypothetical protein HYQ44_019717 [Verticillium longisporum]KAG7144913.1 hypothetical protein HYQ46_006345 [Verticillium longisporum]CRK25280.1 hypothetical protein BN1708_014207 [Verticillium longisporum]CRK31916.1 hypothetical protein BN1723_014577 [Verticillium longisporum]